MAQSDAADAVQRALEHGTLARNQLIRALAIAEQERGALTMARLRALLKAHTAVDAEIKRLYQDIA